MCPAFWRGAMAAGPDGVRVSRLPFIPARCERVTAIAGLAECGSPWFLHHVVMHPCKLVELLVIGRLWLDQAAARTSSSWLR